MKNDPKITCFADLEKEEIRVRKRIRKQEEELQQRLRQLPEEIVTVGVAKVVTGIVSGNLLKTGIRILKKMASYFFSKKENSSGDTGGIFKNALSEMFESFISRKK